MSDTLELVPLCGVDLTIQPARSFGAGPSGSRWVAEVTGLVLAGERLNASLIGHAAADWVTVSSEVATIDVRATVQTDDGALICVQYKGRTDARARVGTTRAYVTPLFEVGDERYRWLNFIQAVGRSELSDLRTAHYEWYELR